MWGFWASGARASSFKKSTKRGSRDRRPKLPYVCYWHKADIIIVLNYVRFRGKADIGD
jgi:hypothetical protein